jgi:iron complex outermembrane recepter protein
LWAGPASAQNSASAADETTGERSDVRTADIIVTANRREERSQDVPVVVTAFSSEALQALDVSDAQDLYGSVPSLTVGNQGTATREAQTFTIRGQATSFLASPAVAQYLNEVPLPSTISLPLQGGPGNFVDLENVQVLSGPQGTLFGRNTTGGAVLFQAHRPTNKLEGYLEGSIGNYDLRALEGAVNLPVVDDKLMIRVAGAYRDRRGFTKDLVWNKWRDDTHWYSGRIGILFKPTERLENYLMAYGAKSSSNGSGQIHVSFNLPALAARGQCTNGTPTATLASCSVYAQQTAIAQQIGPRRTRLSADAYAKIDTWGIINTTAFELTDELTLRNIASFQKLRSDYGTDSDGTPLQTYQNTQNAPFPDFPIAGLAEFGLPNTPGRVFLNQPPRFNGPRDAVKQVTEELQLQGKALDNHLDFAIGAFYFDNKPSDVWRSRTVQNCPAAFTGQIAAGCIASDGISGVRNQSKALYTQATLDLGAFTPSLEDVRLTAGYRYTWDTVTGFSASWAIGDAPTAQSATNPVPDPDTDLDDIQCLFGTPTLQRFVNTTDGSDVCRFGANLKSHAGTWTVGLDYKPKPDLMLYAKVSRGYKSGGFNSFAIRPTTTTFQPEELITYETGFKSDWRLGTVPLRLNATYFYSDYKNIQRPAADVDLPRAGAAVYAATARIQGVEAEASIRPMEWLELGGTVSYTDAKYKSFLLPNSAGGVDCTGANIPLGGTLDYSCARFAFLTPWIYNIHASLDLPMAERLGKLSFLASFSHVSSQFTAGRPVEPGAALEGYGLLNASISWRDIMQSGVDLTVFGTNLTDELFRVSNNNVFGGSFVQSTLYGEPRMYGAKLRYRWGH